MDYIIVNPKFAT